MTLDPLYQNVLLEHYRHPRNFGKLATHTHRIRHDNPLCGDQIELYLELSNHNIIQAIKFTGRGCVISQASASMMTEAVQGKSRTQAQALKVAFQSLISSVLQESDLLSKELFVFTALTDFPARFDCALLAWQALNICLTPNTRVHPR